MYKLTNDLSVYLSLLLHFHNNWRLIEHCIEICINNTQSKHFPCLINNVIARKRETKHRWRKLPILAGSNEHFVACLHFYQVAILILMSKYSLEKVITIKRTYIIKFLYNVNLYPIIELFLIQFLWITIVSTQYVVNLIKTIN